MGKISIVVPCYNMEKKVKRCISSIKKQSYKEFEVLMIDDGSKDKTKEVIKKAIATDKRFKYYYKKNGGLSSARNYGLERATGKYICFIDSDDYIEKDYLKELYNSIIENDSDISICYFSRVYENKTNINHIEDGFSNLIKFPAAWNKLYKTSLFKDNDINYPIGKWYEDLGTFPKLYMISNNVSIIEKSLYNYIQNSASIMHTYDDRIYQMYDIIEDIESFAKKKRLYSKYKNNLEFMNIYHVLVGTKYRASFRKDFDIETVKSILNYVEKKYPKWYRNNDAKKLSFIFRVFLYLISKKHFKIIYILLKLFNRYMNLWLNYIRSMKR